jgi:hypothetical protein
VIIGPQNILLRSWRIEQRFFTFKTVFLFAAGEGDAGTDDFLAISVDLDYVGESGGQESTADGSLR